MVDGGLDGMGHRGVVLAPENRAEGWFSAGNGTVGRTAATGSQGCYLATHPSLPTPLRCVCMYVYVRERERGGRLIMRGWG